MHSVINDYAGGLLDAHALPCLSLCQPTHRHHPDNQQDPIGFGNPVKSMEQSLRQKYTTRAVKRLLEPFQALDGDRDFWNHTLDGLSVLGAPGLFRVYRLQKPVPELAVEAAWAVVAPVLKIHHRARSYKPGSWGPKQPDALIAANGCWHNSRFMNATAN
jgi:hypothetical protein